MRMILGLVLGFASMPNLALPNEAIQACLEEHIVVEAEFGGRSPIPYAEMKITNGLSHAISGLHYTVTVRENGRSVPWLEDETGLNISGGIEPGETRTLTPYLGSISSDAGDHLIVEVTVLDAADAESLSIAGLRRYQDWSAGQSPLGCP